MSQQDHIPGHAQGYRAIRFNADWITRPLFGLFLAAIAVGALFYSNASFACVTLVMQLFAAREWHRMVRSAAQREQSEGRAFHFLSVISVLTIALAVFALLEARFWAVWTVLGLGVLVVFLIARHRGDNPLWHAGGVLYLGLPTLSLIGLRAFAADGARTVLGLFLIVWATDTGALIFGNLIGGPRIAPRLSPGKTWAGTIGGSVTAALVFGSYIGIFGFRVGVAMIFAFLLSFTAHAGDLFESLVKRRFGYKDSGSMIPGHGGVLDRLDSTFTAGIAMALLVFVVHLNPLFGGHR